MADVVTLDDVQSSQSRRNWLKALGALTTIGGVTWFLTGDVDARPRALSVAIDPNIEAIGFDGGDVLVNLAPDTTADEWVVIHEYHDGPSEAIQSGSVPEFGGEVRVPLREAIAADSTDYPTRRFEFVLYHVSTDAETQSLDVERASGVEFELPKEPTS